MTRTLLLLLLTTGCVTLAPQPGGSGASSPRAMSALREMVAGAVPLQTPQRPLTPGTPTCGGQTVPPGWPDFSDDAEALLSPFLTCTSPAEFVALQEHVDMPRLVETLDDWGAVRLGALGPVREDAAHLVQRKRAAFLLSTTERQGLVHAEVFALYVLHSAHDDEVDEVLRLLARDKQLGQTLGQMPSVREELARRGMALTHYPDRAEQAGDVLRGMGRATRDVLSTSQMSDGARYMELSARRARLPPPYQQALHEVERALAERHFAPGNVALGSFDATSTTSRTASGNSSRARRSRGLCAGRPMRSCGDGSAGGWPSSASW